MTGLKCPAACYGKLAACRFCVLVAGGGGRLCLEMVEAWERKQRQRRAIKDNDGAK